MNLEYGYWPTRGLLYSVLSHEIVFFVLAFFSILGTLSDPPGILEPSYTLDREDLAEVIYLPAIGGGSGSSPLEAASTIDPPDTSENLDPGRDGLSYPGPQPILSDPPEATDSLQTLLQPELEDNSILESPLPLPNMVQIAGALTALSPPLLELPEAPVAPRLPSARPAPAPILELPEVADMLAMTQPLSPVLDPVLPVTTIAPRLTGRGLDALATLELPDLAPTELPEARAGRDERNLLAVSPAPGANARTVRVPEAEAGGRFAITPDGSLDSSVTEPGGDLPGSLSGVGFGDADGATGGDIAENTVPGGGLDGSRGEGAGNNPNGTGSGSGVGSGVGDGDDLFSGITIIGDGSLTGAGRSADLARLDPAPLATSYGFTIISTESSGGGLPYFGVFDNEQVHTVYLDMRDSVTDEIPSWTLEFGVPKLNMVRLDPTQSPAKDHQDLQLPRPIIKKRPIFPAEAASQQLRRMLIVYGIIHVDGRLVQVSVKESPDTQLNEPLLQALGEWVFLPAQVRGQAIPVKVLMGIPVWLSD